MRRRLTPSAALWLRRAMSRDGSIYRMYAHSVLALYPDLLRVYIKESEEI